VPGAAIAGLQGVVRELGSLLVEERGKVTTLQEICNAGMCDARTISKRVENLTEAALDAETRLAASVTRAAETALHVSNALPEITDMVRRGITETVAARLQAETPAPLAALRSAITEAASQISELNESAAAARRDITALGAAGREIAVAGAMVVSRLGGAAGQVETAIASVPGAAAAITGAAGHAAQTLTDAAAVLRADSAALATSASDVRQAAVTASDSVAEQVRDTITRMDPVLAALPSAAGVVSAAAEQAARRLAEAADDMGQRVADIGRRTAAMTGQATAAAQDQFAAMIDDVRDVRRETANLADLTVTLNTAVAALAETAAQAGTSSASFDAARQDIAALSECLAGQVDQLAGILGQAAALPDVAARLAQAAERLNTGTEPVRVLQVVPPSAQVRVPERTETARADLARMPASPRAEGDQSPALVDLSADIGESVRRVQAALAEHDGIWPVLQASMAQVEAAAVAVVDAAAQERTKPAAPSAKEPEPPPAQLTATLRRFNELDDHSRGLLRQTEALAEAVLAGRASGLSPAVVDRASDLLVGIDATTRRLRSVATALTLVSDNGSVATLRSP
jgi:hypothetical protein